MKMSSAANFWRHFWRKKKKMALHLWKCHVLLLLRDALFKCCLWHNCDWVWRDTFCEVLFRYFVGLICEEFGKETNYILRMDPPFSGHEIVWYYAKLIDLSLACQIWARCMKTCLQGLANIKGADQPVQLHSLISAFVIPSLKSII